MHNLHRSLLETSFNSHSVGRLQVIHIAILLLLEGLNSKIFRLGVEHAHRNWLQILFSGFSLQTSSNIDIVHSFGSVCCGLAEASILRNIVCLSLPKFVLRLVTEHSTELFGLSQTTVAFISTERPWVEQTGCFHWSFTFFALLHTFSCIIDRPNPILLWQIAWRCSRVGTANLLFGFQLLLCLHGRELCTIGDNLRRIELWSATCLCLSD